MSYFDLSQIVRTELLSSSQLLDVTRNAYNGGFEPFNSGGTVNLYSIGRLESGLYVALRMFRKDIREGQAKLSDQKKDLEQYCLNAESFFSQGRNVVSFCVGVVYRKMAGILLEDLTDAGTQELEHDLDKPYALVGVEKRKVYVDIDHLFMSRRRISHFKYFSSKHIINLNT